jgi:hypothetical protein
VRWLLPLCLLLAGCPPTPSAPECDTADAERYVRFDPAGGQEAPPPDALPLVGSFSNWGATEVEFEDEEGQLYGFEIVVDGAVDLPDVPLDEPVELTVHGFNPPGGDQSHPLLHVAALDGTTLLLAGNVELLEPIGGWTVVSPRDEQSCQPEMRDDGPHRFKPVFVTHDEDERALYAGDLLTLDGMEVTVVSAESNNRNHPFAPCSNEDCPWEKLAWWVALPAP